jgi:hypothetical protein
MREISVILFFLVVSISAIAQGDWQKETNENGIQAYSRIKEGKDYYEFRTVFTTESTIYKAKKLITNIDGLKNWLPSTLESTLLEKVSDTEFYGYTVTDTPWPASNRDLVFKMTVKRHSSKSYTITLKGEPDYYPPQSDNVRVLEYLAIWKIDLKGENLIEIDYTASFDPGSTYPNWLIKNSMVEARMETSLNFRKQLEK